MIFLQENGFFPTVRKDIHIYIATQMSLLQTFCKPTHAPTHQKCQNNVLCGNMNVDVSPYILKRQFKTTCSTITATIHVGLL